MLNTSMANTLLNICYAFYVGGILVVLFTLGTYNANAVIGTIAGYAAAACSMLIILTLTFSSLGETNASFFSAITSILPFILMLVTLGLSIATISSNMDSLANNQVSSSYAGYSTASVMLMFAQTFIFYNATQQSYFLRSGSLGYLNSALLTFLGVLNILMVVNMGVGLQSFKTDG